MGQIAEIKHELVIANHILANEGVVDAFGHISVRHPTNENHYFMACSKAPEDVEIDDIVEMNEEGQVIGDDARSVPIERFIHAGILQRRPDVHSVVHNHSHAVIPFSVTDVPLKPIFHVAGAMGKVAPVWDIATKFGPTDMLVSNMEQAFDLADTLGLGAAALMRGHGCVIAAASIREAVKNSIYFLTNAQLLISALNIGGPKYLSDGEINLLCKKSSNPMGLKRTWDNWKNRAEKSK